MKFYELNANSNMKVLKTSSGKGMTAEFSFYLWPWLI